jgi:ribosomal protein S27E
MNPIFRWIVSHTAARSSLRQCPKCGREQVVRRRATDEPARCRTCGTALPRPRDAR